MDTYDYDIPDTSTRAPYTPDLSIGHLFGRSWPLFKENLGLLIGTFAVYSLLVGLGSNAADGDSSTLLSLIGLVVTGPLTVGFYGILLRLHRHEPVVFVDLFEGFRDFGRALGVYLLVTIGIIVGFVLLIVPGIILALAWWPALFLVADREFGITDTLREAWDLTDGHKGRLFGLAIVLTLVFLAGLLFFVVGVFFTGPLVALVMAAAYEELTLAQV